jgi:hypothetical protein
MLVAFFYGGFCDFFFLVFVSHGKPQKPYAPQTTGNAPTQVQPKRAAFWFLGEMWHRAPLPLAGRLFFNYGS